MALGSTIYLILLYSQHGAKYSILSIGPQLGIILKSIKGGKLLKLSRKYRGLSSIMDIISECAPYLLNLFAFLFIIMFIFSILGTFLFGNIEKGIVIGEDYNYANIFNSMLLNWKILTGEDWNIVMYDCSDSANCGSGKICYGFYMVIYFIIFKVIITFVIMNLFVLVCLQLFDQFFYSKQNPYSIFNLVIDEFNSIWNSLLPTHSGNMIEINMLPLLFQKVKAFKMNHLSIRQLLKEIKTMKINCDASGNIFYGEALFKGLKKVYMPKEYNQQLKELEEHAIKFLNEKSAEIAKKDAYDLNRKKFKKQINRILSTNTIKFSSSPLKNKKEAPFYTFAFLNIVLFAWDKYRILYSNVQDNSLNNTIREENDIQNIEEENSFEQLVERIEVKSENKIDLKSTQTIKIL